MDFELSDQQKLLADTVSRFVEEHFADPSRWERQGNQGGVSRAGGALADLGLSSLLVPETGGGFGGGAVEMMIVMTGFGRGLVDLPFVSSFVIAARLLVERPEIASGEMRVALAWQEPGRGYDRQPRDVIASQSDMGWILNGRKSTIVDVVDATHFLVTADEGQNRAIMFLLPRDRLLLVEQATIDGRLAATCDLSGISCDAEDRLDVTFAAFEQALDWGVVALCAEAVGAIEALVGITAEHLTTRVQFGQAIGHFQALQHRIAEMQSAVERARSIVLHAVAAMDNGDTVALRRASAAAKVIVGDAGRFVGDNAVQLHGGIGVTDVLAVGHYLKRLTAIDKTWGDHEVHLTRYLEAEDMIA